MTKEELHGTITARAELDRAFARLLVEDAAEVMSKNLVSLLQVIERNHIEIMASLEVNATTVKKLVEDVGNLQGRMDSSEADRRQINERLSRIETIMAARPVEREREHQAILDAISERHGDG